MAASLSTPNSRGNAMTHRLDQLREAIRRPLPLAYHPLYRFYEGGSLTRAFRGLPAGADDWWSEDWVGSCTRAGNDNPDGHPQGMSPVEVPGVGPVTLPEIVEALPEEMVGARFAERWGPITGVLVKLLSPAGCRCTPTRPVPGHVSTSDPRLARPKRGSSWTRPATAASRRTRASVSCRASSGPGSPPRCAVT